MRIFHDMTQRELAEKLEISKSHLSEIESGKKKTTLLVLERYAAVFGIPVSSILFFSESLNSDVQVEKSRTIVSSKILALLNFIAERSGRAYGE